MTDITDLLSEPSKPLASPEAMGDFLVLLAAAILEDQRPEQPERPRSAFRWRLATHCRVFLMSHAHPDRRADLEKLITELDRLLALSGREQPSAESR